MNYIFSNVYKFAKEEDFINALEKVGLQDSDTMIFLNQAVPLDHAAVFFSRFNIISLHRINIVQAGEVKWFGEEEMLKRIDEYSKDESLSIVRIKMFYLDNVGVVKDKNGNVVWHISVNDYPKGKMPTTGFYAYNFAQQCLKGGVTLVNFYGSQDNFTGKWDGHDWKYEETVLKKVSPKLLISDSDSRKFNVNIKRELSELEKVKLALDRARADRDAKSAKLQEFREALDRVRADRDAKSAKLQEFRVACKTAKETVVMVREQRDALIRVLKDIASVLGI